jgi:plastocyanin
MVMRFFPSRMTVKPGDTIVWKLSSMDMAPHTVSFYNGAPDEPIIIIAQGPNGPVALVNPAVLFPSQAVLQGTPLNNTDYFNSGILTPGPHDTFSLKVGNISGILDYECILHDTSGMVGNLFVVPRSGN